jgi:cullin 3
MVLHRFGDRLYNGLQEVVNKHLKEVADSVVTSNDDQFLDSVNAAWGDHKTSMLMIRDILMYMVRSGVSSLALFAWA